MIKLQLIVNKQVDGYDSWHDYSHAMNRIY